jgi:ubiquinone/menaquinone biosynthesis C-methylase UbiE
MNQYNRTADDGIYALENRYNQPKEAFKQIGEILNISAASGKLLDLGAATGEFLYYLRTINQNLELKGIEYSRQLIDKAKDFLTTYNISLEEGDANNLSKVENDQFDYVTTLGVTSIFDDFRPSFNEMIRVAKGGAKCLNLMLVNEEVVDVIIKYINPKSGSLESGWNKFSLNSIEEFLSNHKDVSNFEFIKHEMPFDLERKDDPMRSWTKMLDGKRIFWNGLGMEISLYYIVFEISK